MQRSSSEVSEAHPTPARAVTHAALNDGIKVQIRPVCPEDRALFQRGFEDMSEESRYRRFFTAKSSLTEADLRYLTELDGERHFALGAVRVDERGREQPMGVARFIRATPEAEVAEAAVAVVDAFQRKGLGKLLLQALSVAAYTRGVRRFRFLIMVDNVGIRHLLHELAQEARVIRRDPGFDELEITLPLPHEADLSDPRQASLESLLRMAAQDLVHLRPHGDGLE